MPIHSISIDDPIDLPLTRAVEVTVEFDSGERRWCFVCTPDSLHRFGDLLPGSLLRIHVCAPHMIVLSEVTFETIESAIRHLADSDELIDATRPLEPIPDTENRSVWVFNGARASFPGGVFTSRETAEKWILKNNLVGTLTRYPLDSSAYDYAIANGWFEPKEPRHSEPEFIQRFTSASQEHYHYENE